MEGTITKFRRDIFTLVNQTMEGAEVWVIHKGRRFKLTPEKKPGSKLAHLTKCDYLVNEDAPDDGALVKEMTEAWQKTGMRCDRLPRHSGRAMAHAWKFKKANSRRKTPH